MTSPYPDFPSMRVLVVDDSAAYRKILSHALEGLSGVEIVGTAGNADIAWEKIERLKPDLMTLDVEMPGLSGLDLLKRMRTCERQTGVLMVSAFTSMGADITNSALCLGAFDFVLKPSHGTMESNAAQLRMDLASKLEAFQNHRGPEPVQRSTATETAAAAAAAPVRPAQPDTSRTSRQRPEIAVVGISTGGPEALSRMLPQLPADFPIPVVIVQHMPPVFTRSLADDLHRRCAITVCEASDGQVLEAGCVYIAPGGKQTSIHRLVDKLIVRTCDDPPENSCRPSVDYLFRSVAQVCRGRTVAVIMTGMGSDGTVGCRLLKSAGATIIAQDRASCVVFGMPMLPIEEQIVDVVAPLPDIASHLVECTKELVVHAG